MPMYIFSTTIGLAHNNNNSLKTTSPQVTAKQAPYWRWHLPSKPCVSGIFDNP